MAGERQKTPLMNCGTVKQGRPRTDLQSRRLHSSQTRPLSSSSQKPKSARHSDRKCAENSEECKDGVAESVTMEENSSASNVRVDEVVMLPPITDDNVFLSADDEAMSKSDEVESLWTPGGSRRTRSMVSQCITFASIRKTPRNLRNSLLLRRMSPEEGLVVLLVI